MPHKVDVYIANDYAKLTVKDWFSNSPCVDTETQTKIEEIKVKKSTTFHVLIGLEGVAGAVIIYETVPGVTPVPTNYEIPADLDETGKITFPKPKAALQSDLDDLDAKVTALTQQIAGNKRGR